MNIYGEFFLRLNQISGSKRPDLIEKDFHLHRLLGAISDNEFLSSNLVFKGGTCLIKSYLGYFRFSEDVDFTWKGDEKGWIGSPSQTRRRCSAMIDDVIDNLIPVTKELGLGFSGNKSDRNEIMVGSGGRMARFYLSYKSEVLKTQVKTKFEVNFVERTLFPFETRPLNSFITGREYRDLEFLFEEPYRDYTRSIRMKCYDPREIFTDKCRAALTRRVYKLRDILDILSMEIHFGYNIPDFQEQIIDKTRFMVELYNRYKENIEMMEFPDQKDLTGEEMSLLLERPHDKISEMIQKIHDELEVVKKKILDSPVTTLETPINVIKT